MAKFYDTGDLNKVIELCKEAELVVLYNLDVLKSQVALGLPNQVKIIWRFFGYEFYKRMKGEVLSDKTRSMLSREQKKSVKEYIKDLLRPLYHNIKYGDTVDNLFDRAVDRIDYMLVFSKQEYNYLLQHWNTLPEHIILPILTGNFNSECPKIDLRSKSNKVVLGNSRNIFNNHIDVVEKIESAEKKNEYDFLLLFNYGVEGVYPNAVRAAVAGKTYFQLIEEYIPRNDFKRFYDDISALVINGYRQMAMGNVFLALKRGVKVYLNRKNVMMDWLLDEGIQVFSIDNLVSDLENDKIVLQEEVAMHNLRKLNVLYKNYTQIEFQEEVYGKVRDLNMKEQ